MIRREAPRAGIPIATAVRETLREGYSWAKFRADALAGLVVGIVALPLAMALAIASGVPPQYGLYTVIVAAPLIAIFGGSRVNVAGPTAAFVVLLAPVTAAYGVGGLAVASLMAGVILLVMGLSKLGRLVTFIPHPVTTGFTAGIGVVIATLQLKDFFGLQVPGNPEHYWERVGALIDAAPSVHWPDVGIGCLTLAMLLLWPRITKKVPAPLVAVGIGAVVAYALTMWVDGFSVITIGSKFSFALPGGGVGHGIPAQPPSFTLPWNLPGADGVTPIGLSYSMVNALLGSAFAIAMLGAIESLLCAVVADGMAGTRHNPDAELVGQGIGNIVGPFFGGIAATGAIARTATNIRAGGVSPVSALVHSALVFAAVIGIGPLLGYLPMSALAALLLLVAWNMSDVRHFVKILKVAPRSDIMVLLACFSLTVIFDMVVSVCVGVVLAAMLFMKRMSDLSGAQAVTKQSRPELVDLPDGVLFYEVAGPLFFGAAAKAMDALERVSTGTKALILSLEAVPTTDITGLVALQSALARLNHAGVFVIITGARDQPLRAMDKAGIRQSEGKLEFADTVAIALRIVAERAPPPPSSSDSSKRRKTIVERISDRLRPAADPAADTAAAQPDPASQKPARGADSKAPLQ
jgi:SulP family sulfate permease